MKDGYRVYGYRWAVLAAFMFLNLVIQMLWISYAAITTSAAHYYGVSTLAIGFFSMTFMLTFIPLALPESWLIDTKGFRLTVGVAAVLMAVFAIGRGLAGANYTAALLCTVGLGVAQPFMMNSWTKVPARWFAPTQRATAAGLVALCSVLGIALGMLFTPVLADSMSIASVQLVYGFVAVVAAVLFLAIAREHPATPPCPPEAEERAMPLEGLRHAFSMKEFWIAIVVLFIGFGAFNGVTTWIEQIVKPRGLDSSQASLAGGVMLFAGIVGTLVLTTLSDRRRRRVPFLVVALAGAVPGVLGVAFARNLGLLCLFSGILGFFLVSASPLLLQYAAEITVPTPEGATAGVLQLAGQLSVVFVYLMEALKTRGGSFWISLVLLAALLCVCVLMLTRLKEPNISSGPSLLAAPAEPAPEPE